MYIIVFRNIRGEIDAITPLGGNELGIREFETKEAAENYLFESHLFLDYRVIELDL